MVLGMPLKEIHFSPTSRMSSAPAVAVIVGPEEALSCRATRASGELSVKVAAAYLNHKLIGKFTSTFEKESPYFLHIW
jgi:hypothetical protein